MERGYWQRARQRRISRRRVLATGALGAGGAALAATVGCGDDDDDDDAPPAGEGSPRSGTRTPPSEFANARYSEMLRVAINDPPGSFDFHATEQPGSQLASWGVYNGLMYRPEDPPGNFLGLEPELAEAWEQPDELTTVLRLREGVRWQNTEPVNGRPFTAEDVKYNIERMRGEHPSGNQVAGEFRMRDMFDPIEKIEVTDDHTLTITTAFPLAALLNHLSFSWVQMMPRELVESRGDRTVFTWAAGTGPFILEGYDTLGDGGTLKYVRNPDYWKPGQPFFERLELPIMTALETTQTRFLNGDVDFGGTGLQASLTEALKESRPEIQVYETAGFFLFKVYWDMANTDSVWAREKRLRQAMWYFMPYDVLLGSLGVACCRTGPMPPIQQPWAIDNEELPAWGLPLQEAIPEGLKLLEQAGFPAGTEIPLDLSISNFYGGDILGELLVGLFGSLKEQTGGALNINARLNVMELGSWLKDVYRGGGTYEGTSHADAVFYDPDNGFYRYFHSKGVANSTHTSDAKLDDMLERQRRELDESKRVEIVKDIQRYLLDESPTIYIVSPNSFAATQPWVENYKPVHVAYLETPRHWDEIWFNESAPNRG